MSAPDREHEEFEFLLEAHADRGLTGVRRARLDELSRVRPDRRAAVEGFDALHEAFATERALRREVTSVPGDPGEEADPVYQRMESAAAGASDRLANSLRRGTLGRAEDQVAPGVDARDEDPASPAVLSTGSVGRRRIWLSLAAAAVVIVGLALFSQSGRGGAWPELQPNRPDDARLGSGPAHILFDASLRRDEPVLRWVRQSNARDYEVVVEDAASGAQILRRSDELAASHEWRLEPAELEALESHGAPVILRVVARDGAGVVVGTSGDRPLTLR